MIPAAYGDSIPVSCVYAASEGRYQVWGSTYVIEVAVRQQDLIELPIGTYHRLDSVDKLSLCDACPGIDQDVGVPRKEIHVGIGPYERPNAMDHHPRIIGIA